MPNIASLDTVRAHLQVPIADTQFDAEIQRLIDAADEILRKECGEVLTQTYDETYHGGSTDIFLRHTPLLAVESVIESYGFASYTLTLVASDAVGSVDPYSYSIGDAETGRITRRSAGNVRIPFVRGTDNIRVVYSTGRSPIPANIVLAECELVAHWFSNTQLRSGGGSGGRYGYDSSSEVPQIPSLVGVPYRIIELISAHRRMPIIG